MALEAGDKAQRKRLHETGPLSLFARMIHPWVAAQKRLPETNQIDVFRQLLRADTSLHG